jgi:TPP-dependent pyruvate/acetoin dehydrogenase alpha subunit
MIAKAKLEQEPLVPFVQILGPDGTANPTDIVELGLKPHDFKTLYRWMVAGRLFDERALALQRQGRLGTYAPLLGQEAAQVGSAYALKPEDWLFPSYREHAALAMRGQSWLQLLMYWGGNEEGNRIPEGIRNFYGLRAHRYPDLARGRGGLGRQAQGRKVLCARVLWRWRHF